ncbi:hypothetical protein [Legionella lansingensis]|uniref:hypothetical protein n=1 Tax=Legionella lansingensis TaxID=45067 RepID=UPI000A53D278|nr:hypothetical protein [Legionella lansingensis]
MVESVHQALVLPPNASRYRDSIPGHKKLQGQTSQTDGVEMKATGLFPAPACEVEQG